MILQAILTVLALSLGTPQDTQDPVPFPPPHAEWCEYALAGFDPVRLCGGKEEAGDDRWVAHWGRFHYRFVSETNRDRFVMNPERWCIQWDGACARMSPMSATGSAGRWTVHGDRIYIFASDGCRNGFLAAPERYLPMPQPRTNPTADAVGAGERWLRRAVEAHGGQTALKALQGVDYTSVRDALPSFSDSRVLKKMDGLTLMQNGDMRFATDRLVDNTPNIRTAWTLTQKDAFTTENDETWPIHSVHGKRQVRRHAHRQPVTHLWAFLNGSVIAVHEGPGQLQDVPTEQVRVTHNGVTTVLHLDPKTGRILGMHWQGWVNDGAIQLIVESFTEWQDIEGVQVAKARTHAIGGKFFNPERKCFREIRALKYATAFPVRPEVTAPSKDD